MAANGNSTRDDTTITAGTSMSDDITNRFQDLMVGTSTIDATQCARHVRQASPPANNAAVCLASTQTRAATTTTSRCSIGPPPACSSKMIIASKLNFLRRGRMYKAHQVRGPSIATITDELQTLAVGAAAFRPTGHDLVCRFLRPRIAGQRLPRAARFIHDADVYSAAPEHLAATHAPAPGPELGGGARLVWYFFSPLHYQAGKSLLPCRRVGGGAWKLAGGRAKLGEHGEAANWYVRNLLYHDFRQGKSESRTEWRMREHGSIVREDSGRQQPLVLCEVYRV